MYLFYSTHNTAQLLSKALWFPGREEEDCAQSQPNAFFFFSIWLAHLPFGTIYSRKFNAAVDSKGIGSISGLPLSGAKSALCQDWQKIESGWLAITRSWESSHKCSRGGREL